MKNILFLLSILLVQPFFCQAQRLGDFLTNMVAPLDKTEITSDFLWDKGLNGFAEPALFDGIIRDSICIQPTAFGFLYVTGAKRFCRHRSESFAPPGCLYEFHKPLPSTKIAAAKRFLAQCCGHLPHPSPFTKSNFYEK